MSSSVNSQLDEEGRYLSCEKKDQISVRLQLREKIKCKKPNDFSLNHHQI